MVEKTLSKPKYNSNPIVEPLAGSIKLDPAKTITHIDLPKFNMDNKIQTNLDLMRDFLNQCPNTPEGQRLATRCKWAYDLYIKSLASKINKDKVKSTNVYHNQVIEARHEQLKLNKERVGQIAGLNGIDDNVQYATFAVRDVNDDE